jgi:hypothetical protein
MSWFISFCNWLGGRVGDRKVAIFCQTMQIFVSSSNCYGQKNERNVAENGTF